MKGETWWREEREQDWKLERKGAEEYQNGDGQVGACVLRILDGSWYPYFLVSLCETCFEEDETKLALRALGWVGNLCVFACVCLLPSIILLDPIWIALGPHSAHIHLYMRECGRVKIECALLIRSLKT